MSITYNFHEIVKNALNKQGWIITHDPYPLQTGSFNLTTDYGIDKVIAAERKGQKIAIESKSFLGSSKISEFYIALGKFITYRAALRIQEEDRLLYLGISSDIYDNFFINPFIAELIEQNQVYILTYNLEREIIEKWLP